MVCQDSGQVLTETYRSGNCQTPAPCITNIFLHWSLEVINQTNQNMPFWKQKRSTLLNMHKQQSCFIQTIWFGFFKKKSRERGRPLISQAQCRKKAISNEHSAEFLSVCGLTPKFRFSANEYCALWESFINFAWSEFFKIALNWARNVLNSILTP